MDDLKNKNATKVKAETEKQKAKRMRMQSIMEKEQAIDEILLSDLDADEKSKKVDEIEKEIAAL